MGAIISIPILLLIFVSGYLTYYFYCRKTEKTLKKNFNTGCRTKSKSVSRKSQTKTSKSLNKSKIVKELTKSRTTKDSIKSKDPRKMFESLRFEDDTGKRNIGTGVEDCV